MSVKSHAVSSSPPFAAKIMRRWPEMTFSIVCAIALGVHLVRYSAGKPMWIDEILTCYQVTGKSVGAMITSLHTGVNLMPPGYFLLLNGVVHFTDFSPLIARALSSGFIIAAAPVMLLILQPLVGRWFAMLAVGGVLFFSPVISFHNIEARPYGLSLFMVALVGLGFVLSTEREMPSLAVLIFIAVVNALAATSVYFAGLYSACALVVTVLGDWRIRCFRPRVYLAYVFGWVIFALTVLPLCWEQYRENGDEGTQWLPGFAWAWRNLATQSKSTLWPILIAAILLSIVLWLGRSRSATKVDTNKESIPEAMKRLTVLAGLWLLIPTGFILQSRITGRNFYFDRYFISSELGWMILVAFTLALVCRYFTGVLSLEHASWRSAAFRWAAKLIVIGFLGVSALTFCVRGAPQKTGMHDVVNRTDELSGPKVTFDLGVFVEGSNQPRTGRDYWYIAKSAHETQRLNRFWPAFQTTDRAHLTNFRTFVFVDSVRTPTDFHLKTWAEQHGYRIMKVGEERDAARRLKTFYVAERV